MSALASRVVAVVVIVAAAIVALPVAGANGSGNCWSWRRAERKLARLQNKARARHNVGRLRLDPQLSKVARKHSREMDRRNSLHHTPASTLGHRVTRWRRLGEIIARATSARDAHRMFMRSSSHRGAVLDGGYRHFGVGIRRDGDHKWVTVVFSAYRNPGTRLNMPC